MVKNRTFAKSTKSNKKVSNKNNDKTKKNTKKRKLTITG